MIRWKILGHGFVFYTFVEVRCSHDKKVINTPSPHNDMIANNSNISTTLHLNYLSPVIHFISLSSPQNSYQSLKKSYLLQSLLAKFHFAMVPEITLKKHELGAGCVVKLQKKSHKYLQRYLFGESLPEFLQEVSKWMY